MLTDGCTSRPVNATEREVIMRFPKNYTRRLFKNKEAVSETKREDERLSAIGNTWAVPVVAWLLKELLVVRGWCDPLSLQEVVDRCGPYGGAPSLHSQPAKKGKVECPLPSSKKELVRAICQEVTFRGNEVRQLPGAPQPHLLPRQSLPAKWWRWRTVVKFKFKHLHGAEHINVLEMRSFLAGLRWRARKAKNLSIRVLCLLDSQVCLGIIGKGRTSAVRISTVVDQISAAMLASNMMVVGAYVSTEENPADRPSRS